MTPDEIVSNLKVIIDLRNQISALRQSRISDEIEICKKYKVEDCNKERNESAFKYQEKIKDIEMQMIAINTQVETSLNAM